MIPLRPQEQDSEIARLSAVAKKIGSSDFSPSMVPTEKPALERLFFDPAGRLWVRRVTRGGSTAFDVFGADGTMLATIEAPFAPAGFAPAWHGDDVYFVVSDPEDEPQVIQARLDRSPIS